MRKVLSEEYKRIVLDIMVRIDKICEVNNIQYCLFYGALLGAVRHGGYIPWDDDIDIIMLRKDYDLLREAIQKNPQFGLNFIDIITTPSTIYPIAKICDINTKVVDRAYKDVEGYGAFVDVFPFDFLPEDEQRRKIIIKKCARMNRIRAIGSRKRPTNEYHGIKLIKGYLAFVFSKLIDSSIVVKRIDNIGRVLSSNTTSVIGDVRDVKEAFPYEWIFPIQNVIFEGHIFHGPHEIEKCLKQEYGDYLKLPPESERQPHAIECWIK